MNDVVKDIVEVKPITLEMSVDEAKVLLAIFDAVTHVKKEQARAFANLSDAMVIICAALKDKGHEA